MLKPLFLNLCLKNDHLIVVVATLCIIGMYCFHLNENILNNKMLKLRF